MPSGYFRLLSGGFISETPTERFERCGPFIQQTDDSSIEHAKEVAMPHNHLKRRALRNHDEDSGSAKRQKLEHIIGLDSQILLVMWSQSEQQAALLSAQDAKLSQLQKQHESMLATHKNKMSRLREEYLAEIEKQREQHQREAQQLVLDERSIQLQAAAQQFDHARSQAVTELQQLSNAKAASDGQVASMNTEICNLKQELYQSSNARAVLIEQVRSLQTDIGSLKQQVSQSDEKHSEAINAQQKLASDLQDLRQAKVASDNEVLKLNSQIGNLKQEADQWNQQSQTWAAEKAEQSKFKDDAISQINHLRARTTESDNKVTKLENELSESQKNLDASRKIRYARDVQIADLTTKLEEKTNWSNQYMKRMLDLDQEVKDLHKELVNTEEEVEAKLDKEQDAHTKTLKELSKESAMNRKLEKKLDQTNEDRKGVKKELTSTKKYCKELSDELVSYKLIFSKLERDKAHLRKDHQALVAEHERACKIALSGFPQAATVKSAETDMDDSGYVTASSDYVSPNRRTAKFDRAIYLWKHSKMQELEDEGLLYMVLVRGDETEAVYFTKRGEAIVKVQLNEDDLRPKGAKRVVEEFWANHLARSVLLEKKDNVDITDPEVQIDAIATVTSYACLLECQIHAIKHLMGKWKNPDPDAEEEEEDPEDVTKREIAKQCLANLLAINGGSVPTCIEDQHYSYIMKYVGSILTKVPGFVEAVSQVCHGQLKPAPGYGFWPLSPYAFEACPGKIARQSSERIMEVKPIMTGYHKKIEGMRADVEDSINSINMNRTTTTASACDALTALLDVKLEGARSKILPLQKLPSSSRAKRLDIDERSDKLLKADKSGRIKKSSKKAVKGSEKEPRRASTGLENMFSMPQGFDYSKLSDVSAKPMGWSMDAGYIGPKKPETSGMITQTPDVKTQEPDMAYDIDEEL